MNFIVRSIIHTGITETVICFNKCNINKITSQNTLVLLQKCYQVTIIVNQIFIFIQEIIFEYLTVLIKPFLVRIYYVF